MASSMFDIKSVVFEVRGHQDYISRHWLVSSAVSLLWFIGYFLRLKLCM